MVREQAFDVYQAPADLRPALKDQAQRFPARGINVRRLDHLNCLAVDIKANRIFYEPGGNRVEVANAGARLILAPDWKSIVRTEEERKKGQAWGLKTIESFHTHGTCRFAGCDKGR
jgi:catechol 2,3-dioxygenase